MRIVETIAIEATAAQVWAVLSDTERYTDWNPFTLRVKGKLEVGEIVRLEVRLGGGDVRTKHRVSAVVANERICWKVLGAPGWLLGGERCQVIETGQDGQVVFRNDEQVHGLLSPMVSLFYGGRIRAGLQAMNEALKEHCEASTGDAAEAKV